MYILERTATVPVLAARSRRRTAVDVVEPGRDDRCPSRGFRLAPSVAATCLGERTTWPSSRDAH